jgi:hypothetical protein
MNHYHESAIAEARRHKLQDVNQAILATKHNRTPISQAVDSLNRAFAVERLVRTHVSCNIDLALMERVVDEDARNTTFTVGGLGLLNGVLVELTGSIVVVLMQDGDMQGFSHQKAS